MKRIIGFLMIIVVLTSILTMNVCATENTDNILYFEDGSYITISIAERYTRASGTITGRKTYQYTDSGGDVAWKAVVNGTFTYTGVSAMCTSSSVDVTINNSSWYVISQSSGKTGASATGNVTMGLKLLGVTTKKVPVSMTLTCDANGNLS